MPAGTPGTGCHGDHPQGSGLMPNRPRLRAEDLPDEDHLYGQIDSLMVADQGYWRHCRRILKLQLAHQAVCPETIFEMHLSIEAAMDERVRHMLVESVRWAWTEGRRSTEGDPENS